MRPRALAHFRERDIPEELDDSRDEVKSWRGMPFLPVGHRVRVNTNPLGHFLLQEAQVKALLPEVVADGSHVAGIGRWKRP